MTLHLAVSLSGKAHADCNPGEDGLHDSVLLGGNVGLGGQGTLTSTMDKQKWECIFKKIATYFTQLNILFVRPKNNSFRSPTPTISGEQQILISLHLKQFN